jgi:hypothetical protein
MPPAAQPATSSSSPADPFDPYTTPISPLIAHLTEQHGSVLGTPYNTNPTIPNPSALPGESKDIPNPNPTYRYVFADGTVLEATSTGDVSTLNEKTPTTTQTHPNVTGADGSVYVWDPKAIDPTTQKPGTYTKAPGLPSGEAKPTEGAKRAAVEGGRNVEQTYSGGQWVTTSVGSNATPGAAVEGATRDIVDSGRYVTQTYQNGQWVTTKVGDNAIPGAPKAGDKRPSVDGGRYVEQTYDGTSWRTTSVGDSAIPGGGTEGQKRQVVENGRNVTQTFQNGAWTTTGIGESALPGAAKVGDTRQSIENGRNVEQTYDGTTWRTTGIGANALPGAANEGDKRSNVQGGFTVGEVYRNGQWIVDPSVPPTRFTPQDPTVISAPSTQANIATMQNGQISTQTNPNFMPTTTAEVAQRVTQLQSAAQQQRDALADKQRSGAITADQAAQQFDSWWSSNVEPQKAVLDAAQRTAQTTEQQKAEEANRANYATAMGAGQNAVQAQQALMPYMVGPGFGAALNNIQSAYASGKAPGNIDLGSAVTFQLPDMQALATQATNQALAHISPTAAQNMGQATGQQANPQMAQMPQGMDINQQLNRTNYTPTTTVAPDGTVTVSHQNQAPPQPTPQPQVQQHPFYAGLQQGYGAAPQQDFRGLAQGAVMPPYQPSF